VNGIGLRGDAVYWWEAATGVYARGSVPEVGSIISFRPISIMPLGHIAVVTDVVGPREVRIYHANWTHSDDLPDGISRGIAVIDVSERNDWSAVGVAIRRSRAFGNVYPVNGFIYNRPGEPHPIGKIPQMPRRVLEVMAAEGDGGLPVNVAFHSQR
jgi:surface antigen